MKNILLFTLLMTTYILDAQVELDYQTPHKDILELADAPLPPAIRMNEEGTTAILLYRRPYKSIDELSEKEMRLAGLRINPVTNIGSRTRYYFDMKVLDVDSQKESSVMGLPNNPKMANHRWSHDQSKMAFTITEEKGVALWVLDIKEKKIFKITDANLNANMRSPFIWSKDDKSVLVKLLPTDRKDLINRTSAIPNGPTIAVNDGKKAQNRTYQDLLKNPTDEKNFEQLALAELWKVNMDGTKMKWKDSGIYSSMSQSPDGNYVMLTTVRKPYSYLVPYRRFPSKTDLYSSQGTFVKTILELPLIEDLPKGFMSVRKGPRNIAWRADHPATLFWAEALDGGDAAAEVDYRDAVYQLQAPYDVEKEMLLKTKLRYGGIMWGKDDFAIAISRWWNTRMQQVVSFNPANSSEEPKLINERNYQDRYSDPGFPVMARNQYGRDVVVVDNNDIYMIGDGWSEEGKLPFVDKRNIHTGESERIYRSEKNDMLEDIITAFDIKKGEVLTRLESKNIYPNYYKRNIKTGTLTEVTKFDNPFKAIQDVEKEIITYTREDGLELSATLYLPVGYDKKKKEKMPMLMWAYPREYKDKNSASQITSSSNEFTYPYYGSPIYWVNRGYVVLDDTAFPIIGEGEEQPNDSFVKQLVDNAKGAIDAVDNLGYIDREKVAVGGHSYGAFMTANLLTHSDLFAAGIARSGAYNRTLTPFGFQAEERNYWEAPEIYYNMSPFMHS